VFFTYKKYNNVVFASNVIKQTNCMRVFNTSLEKNNIKYNIISIMIIKIINIANNLLMCFYNFKIFILKFFSKFLLKLF